MIKSLHKVYIAFTVLLFLAATLKAEIIEVPPLKGRVTDFTGTLSSTDIEHIESRLAAFEQSKGSQIAVLLLPTTGDETIEQYGIRVADEWKLENLDLLAKEISLEELDKSIELILKGKLKGRTVVNLMK